MLISSDIDPHMYSALAPGAWWEVANGSPMPPSQPYADEAGNAAVEAARHGPLEVCDRMTDIELPICTSPLVRRTCKHLKLFHPHWSPIMVR